MENKIDWRIVCCGLLSVTAMEIVALLKGINGWYLTIAIGIVAGAIGLTIPTPKILKGGE